MKKHIVLVLVFLSMSCTVKPKESSTVKYPSDPELKKGLELAVEKLNLQGQQFQQFQADTKSHLDGTRDQYIISQKDLKHYIDIKYDALLDELNVKLVTITNLMKEQGDFVISQNKSNLEDVKSQLEAQGLSNMELHTKTQTSIQEFVNGVLASHENNNQQLYSLIQNVQEGVFKLIEIYNNEDYDKIYHFGMSDKDYDKFMNFVYNYKHVNNGNNDK
ncbi:MAG: hypothetical protein ACRC0X_01170 [Brevinema sp.]